MDFPIWKSIKWFNSSVDFHIGRTVGAIVGKVHWFIGCMILWFNGSLFSVSQWFIGSMDFHVIVYPACFKTASCPKHIFEHLSFELVHVCFLTVHTYLLYWLLKGLVRCKMHETKCRKMSVSACGNPLKSPPHITCGLAHLTQLK